MAGNIEEFYSYNERVSGLIVRLNKRYRINIVQAYAPTTTYSDEDVEMFYEDVEQALKRKNVQFSFVMGDFNAKV